MSLLDELLNAPGAAEQYLSMAPVLGGSVGPVSGTGTAAPGPTGGTSDWERRARQYFMGHEGYSRGDWNALDSIIERESGWDPNALNEGSGAYGIPQILPSAHPNTNLQGDPMGQIRWLANYISGRYGSAQDALAFKDREGWY